MNGFEEIAVERGSRSGATIAVAVHSTVLGPALGGARMWHYVDDDAALGDAIRLAEAMTHKASAAGLSLGGGKGVIATPGEARPEGELRRALLLDFGDLVEGLEGRYVTAEDVGTDDRDMSVIAERTTHVAGEAATRGGSGDPSPFTALGVLAAIRACAAARFGTRELSGMRVAIIGTGHVGSQLARLLAAEGAQLLLTDIDPDRRALAHRLGAEWLEPAEALEAPCEVLAPCALGGLVDELTVRKLRCEILCGAANNVLTHGSIAARLDELGVLYAPDFIANAGGLINIYAELHGLDAAWAREQALGIETRVAAVLEIAARERVSTLEAAYRLSAERLDRAASARAIAG